VLIDRGGADRYTAGSRSQGFGSTWHFYEDIYLPAGTGLLLDGSGRNLFTGPGKDGAFWTQGVDGVGVGLDAGRAGLNGFDLVDSLFSLFFLERPRPVGTASMTAPTSGSVLHGDLVLRGTADGGPLPIDWVEWRADLGAWTLAEKNASSWASWRAPLDIDALSDGPHVLRARGWTGAGDTTHAIAEVEVQRWLPEWDVQREGEDLVIAFDLATREKVPVDDGLVTLVVLDEAGLPLATFSEGLSQGAGRYRSAWTPPGPGEYTVRAELPDQLLGQTTIQA
jgi:hypothetical protein